MADSANPFDQFDAPASHEDNPFDQFDHPVAQAGPIMAGIRHSTTELKSQVGEAASYGGRVAHEAGWNDLGDWLDAKAKGIKTSVDIAENPGNTISPDAGVVARNTYGITQGLAQMGEAGAAGAATGAAIGAGIGSIIPGAGTAAGALAGGALGWTIANVAALPALMGFSQAGRTADQVAEKAKAGGASEADANKQGVEAGALTGTATAGSQAVMGALGPLGKTIGPITERIFGAATGDVVSSALSSTVKGVAKDAAKAGAVGAGANVAGTAATQGIEGQYGVGEGVTAKGLIDSAVTGFGMTALAHGAHAAVTGPKFNAQMGVLADPAADVNARQKAAAAATAAISVRDKKLAENFGIYAAAQIATGQPVHILPDAAYHALGEDIKRQAQENLGKVNVDPASTPSGDFQPSADAAPAAEPRAPEQQILGGMSDIGSATLDVNDFGGSLDRLQAANNADLSALTDSLNNAHLQRAENAGGLIDMARAGEFSGVNPPDIAERTPTAEQLAPEQQFYSQQAQQAGTDAAFQARDAQQAAPATPADPFADRQAALSAEADRMRAQGQQQGFYDQQMAAGQQAEAANRGTDSTQQPTAMGAALSGVTDAPPRPATTQAEKAHMERLGNRNMAGLRTDELGRLVESHPDPDVRNRAALVLETRRNRDIVSPTTIDQAGTARPGEPSPGFGSRRIDDQGVEFSTQRRESGAAAGLAGAGEGQSSRAPLEARQTAPEVAPLRDSLARDSERTGTPAPGAFEHVTRDMLPDQRTPAANGVEGATTLSKKEYDSVKSAADIFGKKLVLFRQHDLQPGGALDGAVLRHDPNTVYVNADAAGAHHLVVFGHEMAHQMQRDNPTLYKAMEDTVAKLAEKGGIQDFAKYYGEPGNLKDAAVRERVTSEFVSDLVGNRFGEMNTWRQVFAGIDQTNRGLVYRVANFVSKFIDRLMSNTKFNKFATDQMVSDLQATRTAIRRALTQYANERGVARMQHDAEQLKADFANRKEQSTVKPVVSDRADVGRAPDNRAPAPVAERTASDQQSNVGREPIRSGKISEQETRQADRLNVQIPEQLKPEQAKDMKAERAARVAEIGREAAAELDQQRLDRQARSQKAGKASQKIGKDSDILDAISKLGGISMKDMRAIGAAESKVPGRSATFRIASERGLQMDDMAQRLVEEGYLRDDTNVSPRDQLEQAIGDSLSGQPKNLQTEEGMRAEFERRQQQEYDDYVANLSEEDRAAMEQPEVKDAVQNVDDILNKRYDDLTGAERDQYEQAVKDWYERTQQAGGLDEGLGGGDIPFDARPAEAGGAVHDAPFALAGESAAEGRARLTAEEQRAAQQHADARAADQKAHADSQVNDFKLTGSDRAADVGAANGQTDMFSRERGNEPRKTLEQLFEEAKQKRADREQLANDLTQGKPDDHSVAFEHPDGKRSAIAGPDMSKPGGFRTSWFDQHGAFGHSDASSLHGAVTRALEEDYHPSDVQHVEKEAGIYSADPEVRKSAERESWLGKIDPAQMAVVSRVLDMSPGKTKLQALQEARKDWAKKMRQGVADQFDPIRELDQHAYMLARMSKGTTGTMEAALMYGPPVLRDGVYDVDVKGKGAAAIFSQLKGEQNRFLLQEAALRAEELKKAGKENLFTDSDIAALKTLDKPDAAFPDRDKVYQKVRDEYREFNEKMLELARDSGVLSDADYQLFKDQPYVPFYRAMDDATGGKAMKGPRKSGDGLVNQYAFKKLKGGKEKLNADLMANVLSNWSHLLAASAKNRAAVETMDAAEKAGIATRVPSDTTGDNLVRVRHGGKEQKYEIDDPHLLAAVAAMSAQVPSWMKPLTTFKHILTRGVTAMPGFKQRNLIRDSVSALAVGDLSANIPRNWAEGWQGLKHDSQTYASMLASGGIIRMGSSFDGAEAEYAHRLIAKGVPAGNILNSKGAVDALFGKAKDVWHAYEELGDKSENINRAALYQQLLKQGKTHAEAAFLARDMMDFSMQGSWPVVRFLTQSVPFMNARIQGLYKLGRAGVENPVRVGAVVGSVMVASWALAAAYQDDPDWRNRPDWDRDTYWWFKIGDQAFRIPKPFEIGAVGTMAERTWELATDRDETVKRYGGQITSLLAQQLSFNPTPQIVKPMIDVYANKDGFTGRPIESSAMQNLKPEDRYSPSTSMTARFLGSLGLPDPVQLVQGRYSALSPVQMDAMLNGYFGGAGQLALGATDTIMRAATDQPAQAHGFGDAVSKALGNPVQPLADARSQYVDRFYQVSQSSQQAHASMQAAIREGNPAKARELRDEYKSDLKVYPMVMAAQKALSNMSTMEKRIQADPNLSSEDKRSKLNAIAAKKAALTRRIIEKQDAAQ